MLQLVHMYVAQCMHVNVKIVHIIGLLTTVHSSGSDITINTVMTVAYI